MAWPLLVPIEMTPSPAPRFALLLGLAACDGSVTGALDAGGADLDAGGEDEAPPLGARPGASAPRPRPLRGNTSCR